MITQKICKILAGLAFIVVLPLTTHAQSLTFNVTTVTYNGTYSPKHVFAIWITNTSGAYVQTINRQSSEYTKYLTNWIGKTGWTSSGKAHETDGTTGATLSSHNYSYTSSSKTTARIPFVWNCKDYNGNLVDDGTYFIHVEFTEKNTTGVTAKYTFVKGATNQSTSFSNASSNFINASLIYTAPATALTTTETADFALAYNNTDRNLQLSWDPASRSEVLLQLINLNGQILYQTNLLGTGNASTHIPYCPKGFYLIRLTDNEGWSQTKKVLL